MGANATDNATQAKRDERKSNPYYQLGRLMSALEIALVYPKNPAFRKVAAQALIDCSEGAAVHPKIREIAETP